MLQSRRPRRHVKIEEEDALMKMLIDERLFILNFCLLAGSYCKTQSCRCLVQKNVALARWPSSFSLPSSSSSSSSSFWLLRLSCFHLFLSCVCVSVDDVVLNV